MSNQLVHALRQQVGVLDSLLNAKSGAEAHDIIVNEVDVIEAIRDNLAARLSDFE